LDIAPRSGGSDVTSGPAVLRFVRAIEKISGKVDLKHPEFLIDNYASDFRLWGLMLGKRSSPFH
jgi:hypothetical protein